MNRVKDTEFEWINIILGLVISFQMVGFIVIIIYEIFPSLGAFLVIISILLFVYISILTYKEMKIWSRI